MDSYSTFKLDFYVNNESSVNSNRFYRSITPKYQVKIRPFRTPTFSQCWYTVNDSTNLDINTAYNLRSNVQGVNTITLYCSGYEIDWPDSFIFTKTISAIFLNALPLADYVSWPKYYRPTRWRSVDLDASNYHLTPFVGFYGEGHTDRITFMATTTSVQPNYKYTWTVNGSSAVVTSLSTAYIDIPTIPRGSTLNAKASSSGELPVELLVTHQDNSFLLNNNAPLYYFDDVTGERKTYPYFYKTDNNTNNNRYKQNITILPYPSTLTSDLSTNMPSVIVISDGDYVEYRLHFNLALSGDVYDPCYELYGDNWKWSTLENGNKEDTDIPNTWHSTSQAGTFPKKWINQGKNLTTRVLRSPLQHFVKKIQWTFASEQWSFSISDTTYEALKDITLPLIVSGKRGVPFNIDYRSDTLLIATVEVTATTRMGDNVPDFPYAEWSTYDYTITRRVSATVYIAPDIIVYTPNKYVLKSS